MLAAFLGHLFLLEASDNKHILLLHSYNKGLRWSDDVSKGIEDVLATQPHYQLTTEYMDALKNEDPAYLSYLYTLFALKLHYQTYDAVIAADDFAVDFVLHNKDELFRGVPVFFCGIEKNGSYVDIGRIREQKIPLVLKNTDVAVNMLALKKLLPALKHLYIISDTTNHSLSVNPLFAENAEALKTQGIHTTINTGGDLDKIADAIARLPQDSAVLLGTLLRDNQGRYIPYYEIEHLIKHSPVPVFALNDTFLSQGIVGGYLLRGYATGDTVAKLAVSYLQGHIRSTDRTVIAPDAWIFDDAVLRRYRIDPSSLPEDATIINRPQSFFDQHRQFVENTFIASPFIMLSLIIAIFYFYQRYQHGKKLMAQRQWEQILLNNVDSSIFWLDGRGLVQGCNNAFCTMTDRNLGEIIGKKLCDIFPALNAVFADGRSLSVHEIDTAVQEKTYRLRSQYSFDETGKNEGIVCVMTDITEKKQLEIQLQINIQQAKLVEVGEMLSAIVHQWKTPLVELSAVAHKMHYYDTKKKLTSADIQKFYNIIMQQTIYMGETIDAFRDFIRPSHRAERFDIDVVMQDVLSLLSHAMKYHHITIGYDPPAKQSVSIFGYPNELKQVLVNLLNNAKDAILEAREAKHPASGHIAIEVQPLDGQVAVFIRDDGIGIDATVCKKLFEPFFTTKVQGDGFGLYMARLIVESKMHGHLYLEPLHVGARACLELPTSQKEAHENSAAGR